MTRFQHADGLLGHIKGLKGAPQPKRTLWVCGGPGCLAAGGAKVHEALLNEAEKAGLLGNPGYRISLTGCLGLCERGPLAEIRPEGHFYQNVGPGDAPGLVGEALLEGRIVEGLIKDPKNPTKDSLAFYKPQERRVMRRLGLIDPESLDDYLLHGGYEALALALGSLGPGETARRVEESGLRGRGGGGFPAGRKWRALRESVGRPRYVLANGDEGDPGAFMNRALMEGDPFSIIEGMTLGAFAMGAEAGFIYVRHEYPLSVMRLSKAIRLAKDRGLLGEGILGSDVGFELGIVEGGGAFVCGESTALMASIEGREGTPRVKYVRSTEAGLWERPTLLQNVESWANVPPIVLNGPEWFRSLGSKDNPGTKVFSLVGQVRDTGLVELPLGSRISDLVELAGGGVAKGRALKAVQTGGPSGGCLPASLMSLPLDFDSLTKAGAMMGSGGLIVMDDLSCVVDVARYFTAFLTEESCGKCVPCRDGLPLLLGVLTGLTKGEGRAGDTGLLVREAERLKATALCGLGQSAANPILSTVRYFQEEYLEHERGFCRSGRCQGLFVPAIDPGACTGCGLCRKACPAAAIEGKAKKAHKVLPGKCVSCGSCLPKCRFLALKPAPRADTVKADA
ncbi:MAG: 4Fe-4S binding protein [Deltaproteobacteria bacterium]|jgi:NADH-quinone oxidoreductase subunit F|nr:4Fe-4S binding protein [Deltaproteobacteria bacterium]